MSKLKKYENTVDFSLFTDKLKSDFSSAMKRLQQSAEAGDADAMNELGKIYCEGNNMIAQEDSQARQWFKQAAALGHAESMDYLGSMYLEDEDPQQAAQWWQQAREAYEKAVALGDAVAMYNLGSMYAKGHNMVPDDHEQEVHQYDEKIGEDRRQAVQWLEKSAELGVVQAMNDLGDMYHYGISVEENYQKARQWYEKAAALGDAGAMYTLGEMYAGDEGIIRDDQQARQWYQKAAQFYEKAAELGDTQSMYSLGEYALGKEIAGVSRDYVQAHKWFSVAAVKGVIEINQGAARERDICSRLMTPKQIKEAQTQARQWLEQHP